MSVVPTKIPEKIGWYQQRQADWTSNATAIGLTAPQMTSMTAKITAASAALTAHEEAKQAAKNATVALYDAVRAMGDFGSSLLKQIKATAERDGAQVYVLASVPPPAPPSPIGPLGTANDFKVTLSQTGALDLSWKCTNPRGATGTVYQLYRRIGATGEFTFLASVGAKKFTDQTVPAGSAQVQYEIRAVRSTSVGPWALFIVNFGTSSGGEMTTMVSEGTPVPPPAPKMAA